MSEMFPSAKFGIIFRPCKPWIWKSQTLKTDRKTIAFSILYTSRKNFFPVAMECLFLIEKKARQTAGL